MAPSEIEKLERRYTENPQGLTFAPLAEVHRKNGDVARALELLRSGLTLHPDYIPASIVLGRCHLDLGDLPAAEAAFTHVLSLDGENVIALKAVADIAERQHRFEEAESWLRTLLAIDRSNDEARDQLGRVETARRQAETASSASPDAAGPVAAAGAPMAADEEPARELTPEPPAMEKASLAGAPTASEEPAAPRVSPPPMPEPLETMPAWAAEESAAAAADESAPLELEELDLDVGEGGPPPEGIELEQPVTLEQPVEPLSGLVGRDAQDAAAGLEAPEGWQLETEQDIVLESAGGGEFQVANAAEELLSGTRPSARESDPLLPERPALEPEEPAGEPDLVITESMASLLLEQGHPVEALTVYRHLVRRTADPRFQEKIADIERAGAQPAPAPAPAAAAEPPAAAAAPPSPSYSVRETKGQSVQAFLRGMLAGRLSAPPAGLAAHAEPPKAGAETATGGAPTRPAHDSLSLSSVFGEESTPTPPAVPAAGGAGTSPAGVSYDEFFGAPGSGPARSPRGPDPKSDDLDQFHAWLQNLKR